MFSILLDLVVNLSLIILKASSMLCYLISTTDVSNINKYHFNRYLTCPTKKKKCVSSDPRLWTRPEETTVSQ